MLKKVIIFVLLLSVTVLQSCTATFAGSVLVLTFRDIIYYVAIAFMIAVLIAFMTEPEKRRQAFWLWFILSLVVTPLAGFIYLLIKVTKKN